MASGIMLVGEPMGLFIAQSEGALDKVTGYDIAVAGAEFNVAIGMSRLEHNVTYLTRLGDDPFGRLIANTLTENKIGSEFISYSQERPTGFMLKSRVSVGDPEIFYFRKNAAASTLSKEEIDQVDFSNYNYLHLTGILPALSMETRETTFYLIEKARKAGLTISFDPNLRPQLWESNEIMIDTINKISSLSDIVLPGVNEGKILMGNKSPEIISDFYINLGAKIVITKLGSEGAFVATKNERFKVAGYEVEKVIDTVGAGDGFATGVISALMEGESLETAVKRGNAIGAIQVMSRGDNNGLPTREELARFMGKENF